MVENVVSLTIKNNYRHTFCLIGMSMSGHTDHWVSQNGDPLLRVGDFLIGM